MKNLLSFRVKLKMKRTGERERGRKSRRERVDRERQRERERAEGERVDLEAMWVGFSLASCCLGDFVSCEENQPPPTL